MSQAIPPVSMPPRDSIPPRDTLPGRRRTALGPLQLDVQPEVGLGTAIALGLAVGRDRLLRRPTALSALLGVALVIVGAVIERRVGAAGAVDRALAGTFRLIIPLVSFGVAAEAAGRGHLCEGLWPVARYGVSRRGVALGLVGAALLFAAALAAAFAVGSVAVAHAPGEPPFLRDAFQCAWIAALTASAYAAWFSLGATFFKGGRGIWVPLVVDFLAGGSTGLAGAVLPRGNAQSLLGGAAPMHLSQAASSGILLGSAVVLTLVAALRCRR
jgi:hypothetical protein